MSEIWAHATKKNPCPICGKTDWCTYGSRAMLCQRVESNNPSPKGGWYHHYDKGNIRLQLVIQKAKAAPNEIDAEGLMEEWLAGQPLQLVKDFAQDLGVSADSLVSLNAAWSHRNQAWAFPMSDGDGKYIGIRLRTNQGAKIAVTGSRQGIFISDVPAQPICFLPEGPTDTAALLTMGLYAIGRPTCMGGNDLIAQALKRLGIRKVVIVADNDDLKQFGPRQGRPGIEGAIKLKKELGLPSVIWIPPAPLKDARAFLNAGGTKEVILADIKNKVWSKI